MDRTRRHRQGHIEETLSACRHDVVLRADSTTMMVLDNLDLVWREADDEDDEAEALCALVEAAKRFDPERGVPFPGFATTVVRSRIADGRARRSDIPLSWRVRRSWALLRLAAEELNSDLLAPQALARSGIDRQEAERIAAAVHVASLDVTFETVALIDGLVYDDDALAGTGWHATDLSELSYDHRLVLTTRFGLDGHGIRTVAETAELLGLPIGTVLRMESHALVSLRGYALAS